MMKDKRLQELSDNLISLIAVMRHTSPNNPHKQKVLSIMESIEREYGEEIVKNIEILIRDRVCENQD